MRDSLKKKKAGRRNRDGVAGTQRKKLKQEDGRGEVAEQPEEEEKREKTASGDPGAQQESREAAAGNGESEKASHARLWRAWLFQVRDRL
ncbi:hypothetical protein NDU88_007699 [Pleurodeles waltl]|uniref:Uncharacterized protein n=1 Tax=Pleurodeles waltl TaxID=8319 RepID=A0AAV7RTZ4_PLEWA|nr:hypothetical protein NDU88_007699 [Pleurodeles waltl]